MRRTVQWRAVNLLLLAGWAAARSQEEPVTFKVTSNLVVLFFDLSGLAPADLIRVQDAARDFIRGKMTPSDLVSIMTFSSRLRTALEFTDARPKLLDAIRRVGVAEGDSSSGVDDDAPSSAGADGFVVDDTEFNIFNTDRRLSALEQAARGLARLTEWNSSPLIRPLVKTRKAARSLSPEEFCLLHAADFQHRLETEILPALRQGRVVLADRYLFTGLARDASRGLDFKWLLDVYRPIHWPDAVVYLSVSPETSAERVAGERTLHFYQAGQDITGLEDPFESYGHFIRRVIGEYETMTSFFRFIKVDGEQPIYAQHMSLRRLFQEVATT